MNDQTLNFPRFFVSSPTPCPYLEGRLERKVYTDLCGNQAASLNNILSHVGFRRSQNVAYRPACDGCSACVSVRVRSNLFNPTRTMRRVSRRNADLTAARAPAIVTEEQYDLLQRYLKSRHADGGMAEMGLGDYAEMVETSPVNTFLVEYRAPSDSTNSRLTGPLVAVALTDLMSDGLSMVYSFFDPDAVKRSLGTQIILHHIEMADAMSLPYVYLGYWVKGSPKMAYKDRFQPLEKLGPTGWHD